MAMRKTTHSPAKADPMEIGPNPLLDTPVEAALEAHDRQQAAMDAKWGTDVLQTLVAPDKAAKFAEIKIQLDLAIKVGVASEVARYAAMIIRALEIMDREAEAAGKVPLKIDRSWATRGPDGKPWVFVQSPEDARVAARLPRWKGYQIWSLPEVIRSLEDKSFEAVLKAKGLWPDAQVEAPRKQPVDWSHGDEVGI
jgi:hypothetical protein